MSQRRRKVTVSGIAAVVLVALAALWGRTNVPVPRATAGQVVAVIDGDTIGVMQDGAEVRVRLYGIDAPESKQPFGSRAKAELSARVFGQIVTVERVAVDRYGRTVARIYLAGTYVNADMVRAGFAWWYRDFAEGDSELEGAERQAREERRGLWSESTPVSPWEWRKRRRTNQ